MKPDFIGIGAQKSATTWLYSILSEHPEICMGKGEEKDTRFFSCYFDRGYQWYESHFEICDKQMLVGEYSTSYFCDADSPLRIREFSPEIKLIVCLRNPVERAYSNHKHQVRLGLASGELTKFERALENNPTYIDQSLYYKHISKWYKMFTKDQILVLIMDDIKTSPESVVKNIFQFLGVNSSFIPKILNAPVNISVRHKSQGLNKFITYFSEFMKSMGAGSIIDLAKKLRIHKIIRKANSTRQESAFVPMEKQTVTKLHDIFREDIQQLEQLIERDLSVWK